MKFFLFCFISMVIAIPACAEKLNFDDILADALINSYEVQIAEESVNVMQASKREATSAFFPTIGTSLQTDYLHDYMNTERLFMTDNSRWQTNASIRLNYNIFNAGQNMMNYKIADIAFRRQVRQVDYVDKSVSLSLVDLYEGVLRSYHSMLLYDEMSKKAAELYDINKRLNEAGLVDKQSYYLSGIKLADYTTQRINAEMMFFNGLKDISYYTFQEYDKDTVPADFSVGYIADVAPNYISYPEYAVKLMELEQKNKEITANNMRLLPTVSLYGMYNYVGSDPTQFEPSVRNTEIDNYQVGFTVELSLFSGFSYNHRRSRLLAERNVLMLELNQLRLSLQTEIDKLNNSKNYYTEIAEKGADALQYAQNAEDSGAKLREARLSNSMELINSELDMLEKVLEQRLVNISVSADIMRLNIIGRYAGAEEGE